MNVDQASIIKQFRRTGLAAFVFIGGLIILRPALAIEPIQMESGWTYLPTNRDDGAYFRFRKYTFDGKTLINSIIFNCSRHEGNPYSNITFVMPPSLAIRSFDRNSWFPKFQFRIIVDGRDSLGLSGEYRDGEIFYDRTPREAGIFRNILLADSIDLAFGDNNDVIRYIFTEKVDGFISDPETQAGMPALKNTRHFSRVEAIRACEIFQRGR